MELRLKQIRKARGYRTQQEAAEALGMSYFTYRDWEQEKTELRSKDLDKLATFFNTTVDYLIGRNNVSIEENEIYGVYTSCSPQERTLLMTFIEALKGQNIALGAGSAAGNGNVVNNIDISDSNDATIDNTTNSNNTTIINNYK